MALRKVYLKICTAVDGHQYLRLRSSNGNKLLTGETYKRKGTAKRIATALKDRQIVLES